MGKTYSMGNLSIVRLHIKSPASQGASGTSRKGWLISNGGPVIMGSYLVDPASSHMLVSKIKPCMSKYKLLYCETANGSLNQL